MSGLGAVFIMTLIFAKIHYKLAKIGLVLTCFYIALLLENLFTNLWLINRFLALPVFIIAASAASLCLAFWDNVYFNLDQNKSKWGRETSDGINGAHDDEDKESRV